MLDNQRILDVFADAKTAGVIQVPIEDTQLDGRSIRVRGNSVINFGSCSYLGLEFDPRLTHAAQDAVARYGTQYSSSRCYASVTLYTELEQLLSQVTGRPTLVAPTTTLGHLATLPNLVGPRDAILLDMQVHNSVHLACNTLRAQGARIGSIPPGQMDVLDRKLQVYTQRFDRIWFLTDGLYSMYGYPAAFDDLARLLDKYEQLHLYCDDAHSTSWYGARGQGMALSRFGDHPRVVVTLSLVKGFGAGGGGAIAFADAGSLERVRDLGQPFIFSGPVPPAMLAAGIASARIHLSPGLAPLQHGLQRRIEHFNRVAREQGLRLHNTAITPIRFVEVGPSRRAVEVTREVLERGYFTNCAAYPAVPEEKAGLRITLTNHVRTEDIEGLVETIAQLGV